ncbi:ABC transporter ATP-binding protein [Parasphaerochaeta coccoides]|uniref:Polyamine-transporting ATPase n=1 Tax=Parasphaerochaeta coccoides (strain ATCC BAA-1237 / DSM 17374 / SPN1) TaxID=760011 RepID=F4GLM1_PARC1|nr:ATP-binding cassette domain-containing protein [Parasphaerochaeta coccoides]AEC02415.1 Polyamine-transporting ATPase [Parasphaerochaeta coccoides DSM 17374]
MTHIVSIRNLTKAFGTHEVIRNCTISVNEGEIYGFLGANGAGKTTVLKLIAGLLNPTSGRIEVCGMEHPGNREAILRNIGSLIEVPAFYEHLSATENLEIHLAYMGIQKADIEGTLNRVGLPGTSAQPVSQFSLGMRQRLGIARTIIHKPRLLLLDEPINGLDPMGIRDMRELFSSLAHEDGMTLMISSHILGEIEHIANTVGVIVDGAVVKEVAMDSIKKNYPEGLEDYFFTVMRGREAQ